VGLRTRKSSQRRPRRSPAKATAVVTALLCSRAIAGPPPNTNVVLRWDRAALEGVRISRLGAPMVSRALAVVHTCMYDAWAAYDEHAIGTELKGALRRPPSERTAANKEQAISYAAYRALVDLMPAGSAVYTQQLRQLGYDAGNRSTDIETPAGVGNVACAAVLEFRHHDGSNQLGDLAPGPYSDWTAYSPANAAVARDTARDTNIATKRIGFYHCDAFPAKSVEWACRADPLVRAGPLVWLSWTRSSPS